MYKEFSELLETISNTPAANHIFDFDEDAPKLSKSDAELFHQLAAKFLFASKRTRPDIQTAISFLCTRVSKSDIDYWSKLRKVFDYLNHTLDLLLILLANNLKVAT